MTQPSQPGQGLFPSAYPPTWEVPTPILQRRRTSAASSITRVTWQYDPPRRDFLIDGNGRTPLTTADQAAVEWAAKVVSTQRGAHLIYSRSYGADIRRSLQAGAHPVIEAALQTEFRRAVRRDARINDLDSFQFRWQSTILQVAYRVVLANGRSKQTFLSIGYR
jgi:hypothetical protein